MTLGISGISLLALTSSGAAEANALGAMSSTGLLARTGSAQYAGRTLGAAANMSVSNPAGVAGDPSIATTLKGPLLASATGLSLATTADQAIPIGTGITKYLVTGIVFTNASVTPVLAAGAIYTAAAKGGSALFTAAQVYTALTSAIVPLQPTITLATTQTAATLYLALTTANVAACTVDVYVFGYNLS